MKFFYIYLLKSLYDDFMYVDYTDDLRKSFKQHNNKEIYATSQHAPFELVFYEACRNEKDAKRRKDFFNTTKGKSTLKDILHEDFNSDNTNMDKPAGAITCPICGGQKEAPTKSFFTKYGKRTAGLIGDCLTCKGRGWIVRTSKD